MFPAKVWADPVEVWDYADLDAAGQPLFGFTSGAIGEDQVDADSLVDKIEGLGGPVIRSSYTFPEDFVVQAGFQLKVNQITVPGVTTGAITYCSGVLSLALYMVAVTAAHGVVNLYLCNKTGGNLTMPAGVRVELAFINL